jgi:hypothetical protein
VHKVVIAALDEKGHFVPMVPADVPFTDDRFKLHPERFRMTPVISQVSEAAYHLLPHDDVPAGARTLPVVTGITISGIAVLQNESLPIPITKLFAAGHSRPLPFATLTVTIVGTLKAFGAAADAMAAIAAASTTSSTLAASAGLLSGGGFFSQARVASGLPAAGLHPLATRALRGFRSAPPLLTPITTGLTMNPPAQPAPPAIVQPARVPTIPLSSFRLRAVLQSRITPTMDVPPPIRTSVTKAAPANALRYAAPEIQTVPGARLQFVRAPNAPSPTRIARGGRTLRSFETGWSAGQAHKQAFIQAEDTISGAGVTVPAGTTHVWDVPGNAALTIEIAARAPSQPSASAATLVPTPAAPPSGIARVTSLSRSGAVIEDREAAGGRAVLPANAAMVAVACIGKSSGGIAGWQAGNLAHQVGSTTLLCRRSVIVLPQVAATVKQGRPAAQAAVALSEPLVDQPGVETWLPPAIDVVGVLLDVQDLCANADGDLAIAITGADLAVPPVRVAGGRRKLLLYDIQRHDPGATTIKVAVASRDGSRMAGVVGLSGKAREWGARFNGTVPAQLVPDGPSTPDGEVLVRLTMAANGPSGSPATSLRT